MSDELSTQQRVEDLEGNVHALLTIINVIGRAPESRRAIIAEVTDVIRETDPPGARNRLDRRDQAFVTTLRSVCHQISQ